MSRVIGIDLGTTNSLAAVWEEGACRLIPNGFGEYLTPSVVSVDEDGVILVGKAAKERLISAPERTIGGFKRAMGTEKVFCVAGKEYRAEVLSALVLRKLKEDAERYLGEEVEEAVISVPAYFNDMARKATRDAGRLAGLRVERLINEPSAAALACQRMNRQEEALFLVFDFGGGTLDVSLVDCFEQVIEITAVSGDNRLGGRDFDRVIAEQFCGKHGIKFPELTEEMQEILLRNAEKLKIRLTEAETGVMHVVNGSFEGSMELGRKELIRIGAPLFQRISDPVRRVLADGKINARDLSEAVLVGGSCKMPVVRQYLQYLLKGVKVSTVKPDEMIALGVGTYAGIKERNQEIKDLILTDICPFSLGTGIYNEQEPDKPYMQTIISRNSALPASYEVRLFTVADNQKEVSVKVYQGEEFYAKNNIYLGELRMEVPPAPKGQQSILVRYSYDINGLLVVDVKAECSGQKKQAVIVSGENTIPEDEMKRYLKELEKLKIHPGDKEENRLLMARGERIYAQLYGEMREAVAERIKYFEYLLGSQEEYKIRKWRPHLERFLDMAEQIYLQNFSSGKNFEEFERWYQEEEETMEDYTEWHSGKYLN